MKIIEKKIGYTFKTLPNDEFLTNFYKNLYFNVDKNFNYKKKKFENEYYSIEAEIKVHLIEKRFKLKNKTALDLGCGTGSFVKQVSKKFKKCEGVDFEIKQINNKFKKEYKFIKKNPNIFVNRKLDYDFIFLNNILEHSSRPLDLISSLYKNSKKNSYLIISIPNDFSTIQKKTYSIIKKKYWIKYPEHLYYFNKKKFDYLIKNKFKVIDAISDFPIELFLLFKQTNYINNPEKGKICHEIRCRNIIHLYKRYGIARLYKFYKNFFKMDIGRNSTYFLKKI